MHPPNKLSKIKNSVRLLTRKINAATNKTINICLELINFGTRSTWISFGGEYYKYHGGEKEEQSLEIGVYELELLVNLVASYLFEKYRYLLNPTTHPVIYQDDGLVVFKVNKIVKYIKYWLEELQKAVNRTVGK